MSGFSQIEMSASDTSSPQQVRILPLFLIASPDMAFKLGVKPWLGTILLGSAAFDMVKIMET
ncbi:MAG: hypothetical protein DID91_2727703964 [Candidatus Nitrotoga sp. MKT]|nr:MAG: hypothetical protein DID91_2727703964 [Candidatus Nitrotoga sp. MKT]